ncbi:MAG: gephyrin-like molybdotransferase Glp [Acidobacteriota bacterium]
MISISKATSIIEREITTAGSEVVRLQDSVGRILAEDVLADTDMPPFDRSQMDGYAMKAADTKTAPVRLKLVGESAAGRGWHRTLNDGEAIRIMTGAPVPNGADSIQKVELTSDDDNESVMIDEPTEPGKYIVPKGSEIKRREKLFVPGERIDEKMIASLAAFGYARLEVYEQPFVSILGTGTEIVTIEEKPARDQIRNSNSVMLKALCEQAGAKTKTLRQTGDDLEMLKRTISRAVDSRSKIQNPRSKILVITGGVSVGKYDLTKLALRELGADLFFERVRLRPGKPTVFGRLNGTLIFGLPGNPISAAVTFYLFVRTAILRLQGATNAGLPAATAVLGSSAKAAKERDTYLPATIDTDKNGRLIVSPLRWHGSSDFVGFARADVLIVLKPGQIVAAGQPVPIYYLD